MGQNQGKRSKKKHSDQHSHGENTTETMNCDSEDQRQGHSDPDNLDDNAIQPPDQAPPPLPSKSSKRNSDASDNDSHSEKGSVENIEINKEEENLTLRDKTNDTNSHVQRQMSVKDMTKMFEKIQEKSVTAFKKSQTELSSRGKEETVASKAEEHVATRIVDTDSVENSSDIYISAKERENANQNQDGKPSTDHPPVDQGISEPRLEHVNKPSTNRLDSNQLQDYKKTERSSPWQHGDQNQLHNAASSAPRQQKEHQIETGRSQSWQQEANDSQTDPDSLSQEIKEKEQHVPVSNSSSPGQNQEQNNPHTTDRQSAGEHSDQYNPSETDRSSPWQHQEQHYQPERISPWPQHHTGQYPGPQSAHGWPGTLPPPHGPEMYRLPNPRQTPHQGAPSSATPRKRLQDNRNQSGLQHLPPDQGPQAYSPGYHQQQSEGVHHQFGHDGGPHGPHYPSNQPRHTPRQPAAENNHHETPIHSKSKYPKTRQVPVGKGDYASGQKPGGRPPSATTPKRHDETPGKRKGRDSHKDKGTKEEAQRVPSPSKEQGIRYICVSGIHRDTTNETIVNYLEGRAKTDIITKESFRIDDHAIVVFENEIDLEKLKDICQRKKLDNCELKFGEVDPPKMIVASSDDENITENRIKDYLVSKKKLEVRNVHTTEDGCISVKFKNESAVSQLLDEDIKIGGSKVVISPMYYCDHGTQWDQSLHRIAIPMPFKPSIKDKHIQAFLVDIKHRCNEELESHHAQLVVEDEIHIKCTLDPKDKTARQKVKTWENGVKKAWEEFVQSSCHKKELHATADVKDLLVEHINKTKVNHRTEELKVIYPNETERMTFIFVGKSVTVENFHDQISAKKNEFQQQLDRQNQIKNTTVKLEPLHLAMLKKKGIINNLKNIADDFKMEFDENTGQIDLFGVPRDIQTAKVKIYEAKNEYDSWKIHDLSMNQCKLLDTNPIMKIVMEKIESSKIVALLKIQPPTADICVDHQNKRNMLEKIIKDSVMEKELKLDAASKNVLTTDQWHDKKQELEETFIDICIVDDSLGDRVVVTAVDTLIDVIMEDLKDFVETNSIHDETMMIQDEGVMKYLVRHCNNWKKELEYKLSAQSLKVSFKGNIVHISSSDKGIQQAKMAIDDKIKRIGQPEKHSISKPGIENLFDNDSKISDMLEPIEDDTETVILIDNPAKPGTKPKQVMSAEDSDEAFVLKYAAANFQRQNIGKGRRNKHEHRDQNSQKKGPYICKNKTKITLVKREGLSIQKADVLVCSTNASLDLTGKGGKDLVKGAGDAICTETKNKYPDGIKHGEIAILQGHNLNCQQVYLAALPSWKSGVEKTLQSSLNACLQNAAGYQSIVIPALGTGALNYPRDKVAEMMYSAVVDFDKRGKNLKDVRFLCFDDETIKAFEYEEAHRLEPTGHPFASGPDNATGPYRKNNITVTVVKGELGHQKADVLVCAVPQNLNLESAGGSGGSLMKHVPNLQSAINNKYPDGIKNGGFAEIPVSGSNCKAVYLTSIDSWSSEQNKKAHDLQLWKFVYKCLETMDKAKLHSIAIPAMGTGKIGYPPWKVASLMYDIVDLFADSNKKSSVRDVKLVVYPSDTKTVSAFESEERKRLPKPQHHSQDDRRQSGTRNTVNITRKGNQEFMIGDKLKFDVEKGDILTKACDGIVNSTNEDLDFTKGAVAQALRNKCDQKKLDAECANKKANIKKYHITSTSGCGLPAQWIIHITYQSSPREWKKMIGKVMKKAEEKKMKTLAIPALGTGGTGSNAADPQVMGQTIVEGVMEYVADHQLDSLQHVYLVVYQSDMVQPILKGVGLAAQGISVPAPGVVLDGGPVVNSTVSFKIYGEKNISAAKKKLDEAVESEYETKTMHDSIIQGFTDAEAAAVLNLKNHFPVKISVDTGKCVMILEGLKTVNIDVINKIHRLLSNFRHRRHCEEEARMMNEQVQWYFREIDQNTGKQTLREYPPLINMHLENAHRGSSGRHDVDFRSQSGEKYIIDLNSMKEYPENDKTDTVEVIRREKLKDAQTFELPIYWDDMSGQNIRVVTVLQPSQEYTDVENQFKTSVLNGQYKTKFSASTLKVTKIERIQNESLYQMYSAKRKLLNDQNQGANVVVEQKLWHGTDSDAVASIMMYGFNRSYCAKNGTWFGEGVYFANDASYSARNWVSPSGATTNVSQIFLCNVLTGTYCKGIPNMRHLPVRTDGTNLNYDSGVDDVNKPLEFVIFNDNQAYPDYCISFIK